MLTANLRRKIAAAILALAILSIPASASAHNGGYAGYGCSGWDSPVVWYWAVQDCYAGQQNGNYVLIYHHYWGPGAPASYYSWVRLY